MVGALSDEPVGAHEAGFYGSDVEFRSLIVPFVEQGVDAGESVIVSYDGREDDLLRRWVGNLSAVTFVSHQDLYATPARAIATYRRLALRHLAQGATGIRLAGGPVHADDPGRFAGWDRFESAVNVAWEDLPVHCLCLYDATTISPTVRDVIERTHPGLVTGTGDHRANGRYQDPANFAALPAAPDPLEDSQPLVNLVDPSPAAARRAIQSVGRGRLPSDSLDDLVLAVNEAVTNAVLHGSPPRRVSIWAAEDHVVVHVRDGGHGPRDRLAGLVPASGDPSSTSGRGLWIMQQLDLDVAFMPDAHGFTQRIRSR